MGSLIKISGHAFQCMALLLTCMPLANSFSYKVCRPLQWTGVPTGVPLRHRRGFDKQASLPVARNAGALRQLCNTMILRAARPGESDQADQLYGKAGALEREREKERERERDQHACTHTTHMNESCLTHEPCAY